MSSNWSPGFLKAVIICFHFSLIYRRLVLLVAQATWVSKEKTVKGFSSCAEVTGLRSLYFEG